MRKWSIVLFFFLSSLLHASNWYIRNICVFGHWQRTSRIKDNPFIRVLWKAYIHRFRIGVFGCFFLWWMGQASLFTKYWQYKVLRCLAVIACVWGKPKKVKRPIFGQRRHIHLVIWLFVVTMTMRLSVRAITSLQWYNAYNIIIIGAFWIVGEIEIKRIFFCKNTSRMAGQMSCSYYVYCMWISI